MSTEALPGRAVSLLSSAWKAVVARGPRMSHPWTGTLLVLSQVILSLQLPFAVFPLVMFVGSRRKMGDLVAPWWMLALAWPVAIIIAVLNVYLLWQTFAGA